MDHLIEPIQRSFEAFWAELILKVPGVVADARLRTVAEIAYKTGWMDSGATTLKEVSKIVAAPSQATPSVSG